MDQPLAASSWVYVIGKADSSVVKIGKADNVGKRLGGLQTSNPERLVVRWKTPGGRPLERQLHGRFRSLRKEGEWFDFGDQDPVEVVQSAVAELSAGLTQPAPVETPASEPEPKWDVRWPRPDDPDRDNPEYQPDTCGCRTFTPTERAASAADGKDHGLSSYYYTGRPLPGGKRCWGYNH